MCLTDSNTAVVVGGQGERQQLSKDSVWCLDTGQLKWNPVQNYSDLIFDASLIFCFLFFLEGRGGGLVQTVHGIVGILLASLAAYVDVDCNRNSNTKNIYSLVDV